MRSLSPPKPIAAYIDGNVSRLDAKRRQKENVAFDEMLHRSIGGLICAEAEGWRGVAQTRQRIAFLGDRIVDMVLAEYVISTDMPLAVVGGFRSNRNMNRAIVECGLHKGTRTGKSHKARGTLYEALVGQMHIQRGETDPLIRAWILRTLVHRDWVPADGVLA